MKKFFITFTSLLFSLLVSYQNVFATSLDMDDPINIEIKKETIDKIGDNKEMKSKKSSEDIFGDEQTFPFVAGLGKNAAH